MQYDLRNDAFAALLRLGGAQQDELRTGQVVSRSISDITLIQTLLQFLPNLTGNALMFLFSLVFMALLSPLLTVVALVVGPLLWLIALRSRRDLFPANWHAQQEAAEVASTVEATVTGVRVVKGFGQERRELEGLEQRARKLFASRLRVVGFTSRYNPALQAVPALGQVAVLALGGWMALHGRISLGTFLAFTTYLGSFVTPVRQVATLLTVWQQARACCRTGPGGRRRGAGDHRRAVRPGTARRTSGPLLAERHLRIRGRRTVAPRLQPGHPPGRDAGPDRSGLPGKSTAAALLPRFYDVPAGSVRVGGSDVRELALASLRSRIGFVFEESLLLSDTVRANIAYGIPDATDEQVRAAARIARADEFIERLPQGYDTVVGEQGLTLSGGQRQRMALARALIGDPAVLVLDDATSAIDARVESQIHQRLREDTRRRTTLIVAHRRSTLELADRIAVLDEGRIVDTGTLDELRSRSGLFRNLLSTAEATTEAAAENTEDTTAVDGAELAADVPEPAGGTLTPTSGTALTTPRRTSSKAPPSAPPRPSPRRRPPPGQGVAGPAAGSSAPPRPAPNS